VALDRDQSHARVSLEQSVARFGDELPTENLIKAVGLRPEDA